MLEIIKKYWPASTKTEQIRSKINQRALEVTRLSQSFVTCDINIKIKNPATKTVLILIKLVVDLLLGIDTIAEI